MIRQGNDTFLTAGGKVPSGVNMQFIFIRLIRQNTSLLTKETITGETINTGRSYTFNLSTLVYEDGTIKNVVVLYFDKRINLYYQVIDGVVKNVRIIKEVHINEPIQAVVSNIVLNTFDFVITSQNPVVKFVIKIVANPSEKYCFVSQNTSLDFSNQSFYNSVTA